MYFNAHGLLRRRLLAMLTACLLLLLAPSWTGGQGLSCWRNAPSYPNTCSKQDDPAY